VIVTVPLAILQRGDIAFTPALPSTKTDAIANIGMGPGMKVILRFSSRFWPEKTGSIYGAGLVPEFWATAGGGRSSSDDVLTAFVHGDNAATLSAMNDTDLVAAICAQLDTMFGGTVATSSLTDSHIQDWGKEPYIGGTYSYPIVGGGNARKDLADAIDGKLFFAGEATHYEGHFATVHGALETAYRAAEELVGSA
jgi:monoamine oxidase